MSRRSRNFRTPCGSTLLVLLTAASTGCGLVKFNVNGQPMGGSQSTAANPAAVAAAAGQADQSKLALPKTVGAKVGPASLKPRLTTEVIKVAVEQNASDLGFRCGTAWAQGYSTAAPAYSFEVTEAFDLSVRLADSWDGVASKRRTSQPAVAMTWAICVPMMPAPTTPTTGRNVVIRELS